MHVFERSYNWFRKGYTFNIHADYTEYFQIDFRTDFRENNLPVQTSKPVNNINIFASPKLQERYYKAKNTTELCLRKHSLI